MYIFHLPTLIFFSKRFQFLCIFFIYQLLFYFVKDFNLMYIFHLPVAFTNLPGVNLLSVQVAILI